MLLLVAVATFVAAYYLPLHLAHERLTRNFREQEARVASLVGQLTTTQHELKSASERPDQLQAAQDLRESTTQSDADRLARARSALASKLDRAVKKGNAALASRPGVLLVGLDAGALFLPQKMELAPMARALVCDAVKSAQPKAVVVHAVLAEATPPTPLSKSYPPPWGFSAARAAAVAQLLESTCGLSAARISASGDGSHDGWAAELANSKLPPDRIELELTLP